MDKKTRYILSILSAVIFIIISFFYIKYSGKLEASKVDTEKNGNYIVGVIERKQITKDFQYLEIKDKNNNIWKINISDKTIFKQMLRLENGDEIKVLGDVVGNDINAREISGLMLQKSQ